MLRTDYRIRWWLTSMGHTITGHSEADVQALFLREAAQWGLTPDALRQLILECAGEPADVAVAWRPAA